MARQTMFLVYFGQRRRAASVRELLLKESSTAAAEEDGEGKRGVFFYFQSVAANVRADNETDLGCLMR